MLGYSGMSTGVIKNKYTIYLININHQKYPLLED